MLKTAKKQIESSKKAPNASLGVATKSTLTTPKISTARMARKVEPFEQEVIDWLREEATAAVRKPIEHERELAGAIRAIAFYSPAMRMLFSDIGELLVQKKSFDRPLFIAAVRSLGEAGDRRCGALVKAGAEHESSMIASLCAASWLSDSSLTPILNRSAVQRSAHIAFTAELARVLRGESPGIHLCGVAPKIKESHRIGLCAEVLVPISRMSKIPVGVQQAFEVLRNAERHLGRWLVMAELSVRAGDTKPIQEAREKAKDGPSGARTAWAYVAWALDASAAAPTSRPTAELIVRLSDRPSVDRDNRFLFRLAHAGVRTIKSVLEMCVQESFQKEDDSAIRAAGYLVRDYGRDDLVEPLTHLARHAQRESTKGLAVAVLWDAGHKDLARTIATEIMKSKLNYVSTAWATLVLLADVSRIPMSTPVAHEPMVRWLNVGWLE